jgi:hypothetical protein
MSLTFLSSSVIFLIGNPYPSLKSPWKGASLQCFPKWGPNRDIQNEFPFRYGQSLGKGFNFKFIFDFHNPIIILQFIYINCKWQVCVFYFKHIVKLWKSTAITFLDLTALLWYKTRCHVLYQKISVEALTVGCTWRKACDQIWSPVEVYVLQCLSVSYSLNSERWNICS